MNITKHGKRILIIGLAYIALNLVILGVFGLKLSVDFTGGTVSTYLITENGDSSEASTSDKISKVYTDFNISINSVEVEDNVVVVKTPEVSAQINDEISKSLEQVGFKQESYETVGSVLGKETIDKSLKAVGLALLGTFLYIAYAFRQVPAPYKSYKFAASAIIAMLHDVIAVLGFFALLGVAFGIEVDVLFVTALLTIIGFSVNDTIIVFDRIRENLQKNKKGGELYKIVDRSIGEVLRRSIITSCTLILVLILLFFFGGSSVKYFVLAFIFGVTVGTYSSIFIASPLLVMWEQRSKK